MIFKWVIKKITHLDVGGRLNKSVHHLLTNGAVDNVA